MTKDQVISFVVVCFFVWFSLAFWGIKGWDDKTFSSLILPFPYHVLSISPLPFLFQERRKCSGHHQGYGTGKDSH